MNLNDLHMSLKAAPAVHGASGSFTTYDGYTVTVTDGLITSITSDRR